MTALRTRMPPAMLAPPRSIRPRNSGLRPLGSSMIIMLPAIDAPSISSERPCAAVTCAPVNSIAPSIRAPMSRISPVAVN